MRALARLLLTAAPWALIPTPAGADPITLTVLGTTITINVAAIAVNLALSIASSLLMRGKKPKTPEQMIKANPVDGAPFYRYAYGNRRVGGYLVGRQKKGKKVYLAFLMQCRPSEGPFVLHLDGRKVTMSGDPYDLAGSGAVSIDPAPPSSPPEEEPPPPDLLAGHVRMWIGRGGQTAIPSAVAAASPRMVEAGAYPGFTVLWLEMDKGANDKVGERWPSGVPTATLTGGWSRIWDPRDPAQSPTDPATWRYSANQDLVVLDMLRHEDCYALPLERIDVESFRIGADICDEPIPLRAGGAEPRYEAHGVWEVDGRTPWDFIQPALQAGASEIQEVTQGDAKRFVYIPGKFVAPTLSLADAHIGRSDIEITTLRETGDVLNAGQANIISEARNFEMTPLPRYVDAEALAADGSLSIVSEDFSWVKSPGQGARLIKRRVQASRLEGGVRASWMRPALQAHAAATVDLTGAHLPLPSGSRAYFVESWALRLAPVRAEDGLYRIEIPMSLRQTGPEIDAWSPLEEPIIEASPEIETPLPKEAPRDLTVTPELLPTGDGSEILTARVSALPPVDASSVDAYAVRWRRVYGPGDYEGWSNGAAVPADDLGSDGRFAVTASPLAGDAVYEFQASSLGARSRSDWASVTVTITPPGAPPAPPEALGIAVEGGAFETRWRSPASADVRRLAIYFGAAADFASAEMLDTLWVLHPGEAAAYHDPDAAPGETRHYWATTIGKWGAESAPSARLTATVPL